MIASAVATTTKPAMTLGVARHGIRARLRDLWWLLRLWFGTVPRAARFWIVALLSTSVLSTAGLWAARELLNALSAGLTGTTVFWFVVIAATIALERILGTLARYREASLREVGIPHLQATVLQQSAEIDLEAYESSDFYDAANRIATQLETKAGEALPSIYMFLSLLPSMVGNMILLAVIDWRAAILLPLPAIPVAIITLRFGETLFGFVREQTRDVRIAGYLVQQLTGRHAAKEIRLFGLQRHLIDRWEMHYRATRRELRLARFRTQLRGQVMGNASFLLPMFITLWLIFVAVTRYSPGDTLILVSLQFIVASNYLSLGMQINKLAEFAGFASDVRALAGMPSVFASGAVATPNDTRRPPGSITFEHVSFRYPGTSARVLEDLTFTIHTGEHVAIVGENGAGKTTLIKLALGLYRPDSGRVLIDGIPVHDIPMATRHIIFSAVFQQFSRYPLSARDNIVLDRDDLGGQIEEALDAVGMRDTLTDLPAGLDTILGPDLGGTDLSGGQWQRLAITRAGIRNAAILALDEPTAALDPMAEVVIFRRFNHISAGRTTLLVSHRLGMARLADRILVIDDGTLVEDGHHTELVARNGVYAHLWNVQSRWYQ